MFSSPSKGKAKEDDQFQPGWWELYPLVERQDRPVAWSADSTIFTAHGTEPHVVGRLFPSSRQFAVPSPGPILNSPSSYLSPTTITVSPNSQWLFAFFPSRDGEGIGCLWEQGPHVDNWNIKECWPFAKDACVITSAWLGHTRQWTTSTNGRAARPPPLGPPTPVSSPTLLLVTENLCANLCYVLSGTQGIRNLSCSLSHPELVQDGGANQVPSSSSGAGSFRSCVRATIGMVYNDSSIIIATQSRTLATLINTSFPSLDPLEMAQPFPSSELAGPSDWEHWGEESVIEFCEVRLGLEDHVLNLSSNPLSSQGFSTGQLSSMIFVPRKHPADPRGPALDAVKMHLIASFVDFGNYVSKPTSELISYSLRRDGLTGKQTSASWDCNRIASRSFSSDIPTFLGPHDSGPHIDSFLVCSVDTSINIPRRKRRLKETPIGKVQVMQVPDLTTDGRWQTTHILGPGVDHVLQNLPINVAISPNGCLLCSVSPGPVSPVRVTIHPTPRRTQDLQPTPIGGGKERVFSDEACALLAAIRSRKSTADIVHRLSRPSTPIYQVESILYETLALFQGSSDTLRMNWYIDAFALLIEVYRTRAQTGKAPDAEDLSVRWKFAQELCSVAACANAFEDARDGDQVDLEAVWPLIDLSKWLMDFTEVLMKECVLLQDDDSNADGAKILKSVPPVFLHLLHPLAFRHLMSSLVAVKRFHDYLKRLNASAETAQIAKNVLLDIVQCSGLKMKGLESSLMSVAEDINKLNGEDLRRSLACCRVLPSLHAPLQNIVRKILDGGCVDKPRLFIKPSDFVTGVSTLQIVDDSLKDRGRDIVSKGALLNQGHGRVCLQCGGRSERTDIGDMKQTSLRWRAWEHKWTRRCICGGLWASRALPILTSISVMPWNVHGS